MTLKEKLDKILSVPMDPKRSELHTWLPDWASDIFKIWEYHRCEVIYYDDLANFIRNAINWNFTKDLSVYESLVDGMLEDMNNHKYGFVVDW